MNEDDQDDDELSVVDENENDMNIINNELSDREDAEREEGYFRRPRPEEVGNNLMSRKIRLWSFKTCLYSEYTVMR